VPRTRVQGFTTLLLHNRLSVRFTALFALAAAGFLIGQTVAYLWLPEGLLRGASIGAAVATDQAASGFTIEWARIVAWNLPIMGLFFVAPNLIRFVSGIPFGYVPAITMTAYFGIITGTNSFTMAAEVGKIGPSLEWLPTRVSTRSSPTCSPPPLPTKSLGGRSSRLTERSRP
jgi:hypothetical protein